MKGIVKIQPPAGSGQAVYSGYTQADRFGGSTPPELKQDLDLTKYLKNLQMGLKMNQFSGEDLHGLGKGAAIAALVLTPILLTASISGCILPGDNTNHPADNSPANVPSVSDEGRPQSAVAYNNMAIIHAKQGDNSEALKDYNKAIALDPNYSDALNNKGILLYNLSRYNESIESFDKSLEIAPKEAWVWYAKGSALYRLEDYDAAIKSYDKAIALNPRDENVLADKAYALYNLGKYEESVKYFDKSITIDPTRALIFVHKAYALEQLGRYEEASKCFNESLKLGLTNKGL